MDEETREQGENDQEQDRHELNEERVRGFLWQEGRKEGRKEGGKERRKDGRKVEGMREREEKKKIITERKKNRNGNNI